MVFKQLIGFALIILIVIVGGQMGCYSAQNDQLALSIISASAMGEKKREFAIGDPVWVTVSLLNKKNEDVTVWLNGTKDRGISFEADQDSRDKVKILTRTVALEINFRKVIIKGGEQMTFDLLLNDFLQITEVGDIRFNCTMQLKDMNRKPLTLIAVFSMKFARKLNTEEIRKMIKCLELQLESKVSAVRLRATKSMQAIHTAEAVPFLSKAIADEDESVQLAAIKVLSSLKFHEATIALEKALTSDKDSVKRAAKLELDRRKLKQE